MINPVIIQIIGVLMILFFFVVLYLCSKTWRITHVIFTFLLFAVSIWFLTLAAMSMKTRSTWRTQAKTLDTELQTERKTSLELSHGDLSEVRQTTDSLRSVRGKWSRAMLDRGRVWRQCTPSGIDNNAIVVSTVPPGVADADATPNGIAQNELLYVFKEAEVNGIKVPITYLGEYQAAAVTDTNVTISPTLPLGRDQLAAIQNNQNATWALYEMMPVDGHRMFAADPDAEPDLNVEGEPIFGQIDQAAIEGIFRMVVEADAPNGLRLPADFPSAVQQYVRDGQRADTTNDPPEDVWVKVKFIKPHTEEVDSETAQGGLSGGFFDARGRAVIDRLRRSEGEVAEFEPDDIGVFPRGRADELIGQGICEEIEPIYVRPLTDYDHVFHKIVQRLTQLRQDTAEVQRNTQALQDAKAKTEQQIAYRKQEYAKLEQDRDKLRTERDAITKYAQELTQHRDQLKADLSSLYQANLRLAEELAQMQQRLTDEINRQTADAAASASGE